MSWESGWRHTHICTGCGRMAACSNPSCSEPERCRECEEADESVKRQIAELAAKIIAAVSDRKRAYEIPSKAIVEGMRKP